MWGDYSSLRRLLWILLDNAAKYTPAPGTIQVTVSAAADQVSVTVEDHGIGIPAADLPHIFERFYRADPSRSQVEGSGLGLAIAKWIADIHHARFTVESQENSGSVFQLVFPVFVEDPGRRSPSNVSTPPARNLSARPQFIYSEDEWRPANRGPSGMKRTNARS